MNINCSMTPHTSYVNRNNVNNISYNSQKGYYPAFTGKPQDTQDKKINWTDWFRGIFSPKAQKTENVKNTDEEKKQDLYNKTCMAYQKRILEKHGLSVYCISPEATQYGPGETEALADYKDAPYNIYGGFTDKLTFLTSVSTYLDGLATGPIITIHYPSPGEDIEETPPKNEFESRCHKLVDSKSRSGMNEEYRQKRYEEELQYLKNTHNIEILEDDENDYPSTYPRIYFTYKGTEYTASQSCCYREKDKKEFTYDFARFLSGFDDFDSPIIVEKAKSHSNEGSDDEEFLDADWEELDLKNPQNQLERIIADVKSGKRIEQYLAT